MIYLHPAISLTAYSIILMDLDLKLKLNLNLDLKLRRCR